MRALTVALLLSVLGCSSRTLDERPEAGVDASTDLTAPADVGSGETGNPGDVSADRGAPVETGVEVGKPSSGGFVVRASLMQEGPGGSLPIPSPGMLPASDTFSLYLDLDRNRVVASRGGTVGIAPLRSVPDGWKTTGPFRIGTTAGYSGGPCGGWGGFSYDELEIIVDGSNLRGTFKGGADYLSGDVVVRIPFNGTFTAAPDRDPPTFTLDTPKPHPADSLSVSFSEALPADTTVSLVAPDGSRRAFVTGSDPGQPRAAFVLGSVVGILNGHKLAIEPALRDLAGNAAPELPMPPIESIAIPLLPEDGFEGTTSPYLTGAAKVGPADYPAISGQRSLLLPAYGFPAGGAGRVTLRLAVAPGDKFVRATIRAILPLRDTTTFMLPFIVWRGRAGAAPTQFTVQGPVTPHGNQFLGAPQPLEVALPAGSAGEVLIDMNRHLACGLPFPFAGALIDDLRVE